MAVALPCANSFQFCYCLLLKGTSSLKTVLVQQIKETKLKLRHFVLKSLVDFRLTVFTLDLRAEIANISVT